MHGRVLLSSFLSGGISLGSSLVSTSGGTLNSSLLLHGLVKALATTELSENLGKGALLLLLLLGIADGSGLSSSRDLSSSHLLRGHLGSHGVLLGRGLTRLLNLGLLVVALDNGSDDLLSDRAGFLNLGDAVLLLHCLVSSGLNLLDLILVSGGLRFGVIVVILVGNSFSNGGLSSNNSSFDGASSGLSHLVDGDSSLGGLLLDGVGRSGHLVDRGLSGGGSSSNVLL
mmetsp:Transcript_320/g.748  ORF Transcript_320/g.748 Transcript_320/m.748 type:complete len:228 (-) Transcript_320:867-1550(-)